MRILRRIAVSLLAVLVIVGGGLVGLIANISPDKIVAEGTAQVRQITGFSIEAETGATLTYWPNPGLQVSALTVRDATGRQIIDAPTAVIGLSYKSLLTGQIRAGSVHLADPRINLTPEVVDRLLQDPRAASAWGVVTRFSTDGATLSIATGDKPIDLQDAIISIDHAGPSQPTIATIKTVWQDRTVSGQIRLETLAALHAGRYAQVELQAAIDDAMAQFKGRVRLAGDSYPHLRGKGTVQAARPALISELLGINLPGLSRLSDAATTLEITSRTDRLWLRTRTTGVVHGRETSLDATLSADAGWMENSDFALDLAHRTGGLYSIHFNGRTNLLDQVTGSVRGAVLDLPTTLDWTELQDAGSTWSRASISGELMVGQTGIAAQSIRLLLDDTPIRGSIAADLRGNQPLISANIQAREISLPFAVRGKGSLAELRDTLNADAVTLDLALENTWIAGVWVDRLDATLTQETAGLTAEAPRLDAFGGTAVVTLGVKNDPAEPVEGSVRGAELDAAALMKALDLPEVTGRLGGEVRFKVLEQSGRLSVLAGDFVLTDGAIPVPDLGAVAEGRDAEKDRTAVDVLGAQVGLTDGAVQFSDVQITTGDQALTGSITFAGNGLTGRLATDAPKGRLVIIEGPMDKISATLVEQPEVVEVDLQNAENPVTEAPPAEEAADDPVQVPETEAPQDDSAPVAAAAEDAETPEGALTGDDQIDQAAEATPDETDLETDGLAAPEVLQSPVPLPAPR